MDMELEVLMEMAMLGILLKLVILSLADRCHLYFGTHLK